MEIKINGKKYKAKKDETIFSVCKRNGIKLPSLCSTKEMHSGVCRICVVDVNGKIMTSCNTNVSEGMVIKTESEDVKKTRRINLELLWADHAGKCSTCKKNQMCQLQKLAKDFQIENFHFVPRKGEMTNREELDLIHDNWTRVAVEDKNPCISRNSELCIECRRCINVCPEKKFGFNYRGSKVLVGTEYENVLDCSFCGKCVEVCPTGALTDKNDYLQIIKDLDDLKKFSVAVMDLGIREKILACISGMSSEKNIDNILYRLGFEKIFNLENEDSEDKKFERIKTEYAYQEKINSKDIVTFFISSKICKKVKMGEFLDHVLSDREVARLLRDKEKIKEGKIRM